MVSTGTCNKLLITQNTRKITPTAICDSMHLYDKESMKVTCKCSDKA